MGPQSRRGWNKVEFPTSLDEVWDWGAGLLFSPGTACQTRTRLKPVRETPGQDSHSFDWQSNLDECKEKEKEAIWRKSPSNGLSGRYTSLMTWNMDALCSLLVTLRISSSVASSLSGRQSSRRFFLTQPGHSGLLLEELQFFISNCQVRKGWLK